MNTKWILTFCSIALGLMGTALIFAPDNILGYFVIEVSPPSLLIIQLMGGLYFGFGMLNWMIRDSHIGGIYNRPVTIANLSHFLIGGLALTKELIPKPNLPVIIWITTAVYIAFGLFFTFILFRHPSSK